VWDYDAAANNLVLSAATSNTNLAGVSVTATNVATATNAIFTLTFAPVTNAFGAATISLTASEVDYATNATTTIVTNNDSSLTTNVVDTVTTNVLTSTNSFVLTVNPVSQPPSFSLSTNVLVVAENTGLVVSSNFLTGINIGAGNPAGLTWAFSVFSATNSSTNARYAQFPSVTTNGTLSFNTTNYSFGTNLVTVVMTDSGLTNGGINTCTNSFQLQVVQGQYPPAFAGLTNRTILENATTNISMSFTLFDPLTTNFTVTCSSANTNVVTVSITGAGTARTLWFAPVTNAFGSNITVSITADDGTLTNSTSLNVTVLWVNQAPSFNLAQTSVLVSQYDTAVSLANAVTNILAGPTNESSQTVSFIVTNSKSSLFLTQPTVTPSGTLIFTPARQGGTVTVGIKAQDNGGTSNGGVDTSAVQMLTITIPANPFQTLAGTFTGLFYDTNAMALDSSGYFSLTPTTDGSFNGFILCAGTSNSFSGQFSVTAASSAYTSLTSGNYALNLVIDTGADWTQAVDGSVSNTVTGWNAELQSYLPGYSTSFPTALAGLQVMALHGFDDPSAGPVGDGVFDVSISSAGVAALTGYVADDTFVSRVNPISLSGYFPVYAPLYGADKGLLMGWLEFNGALPGSTDTDSGLSTNSFLVWFNAAGATALYPNGFTNQAVPVSSPYNPAASAQLGFSSGYAVLSGGNLGTPITNGVTIAGNILTVDPSATNGLNLQINNITGEVLGSFIDSNGHTNYIDSAILQNTNVSSGFFINADQSGSFMLYGN
jgi:hypothetical protein